MDLKSQFLLRPDISFLNFGSFGACPKPVFDVYQAFQRELENEPVLFMLDSAIEYLRQSRIALGQYLNCHEDDVVCVTNPSYAVNIVARNLDLNPGDEVLSTDLEYGACDRAWSFYCRQKGATYVRNHVSLPITDKESFVEEFFRGVTSKTKLIFISQITSATALRFPVEEICRLAKNIGIPVFIDGAHAPGQIEVNLREMDPDYYTAAAHKWMISPKGASFLYARKDKQSVLDPLVVSWGYESAMPSHSQFLDYHEMQGTRDLSAFCSIPAAIQFMADHDWVNVRKACRQLALENAPRLFELCGSQPLAPLNDDWFCQMVSAKIQIKEGHDLHQTLFREYKVQVPIMPQNGEMMIRYSINAFNDQSDLDRLFEALKDLKQKGVIGKV